MGHRMWCTMLLLPSLKQTMNMMYNIEFTGPHKGNCATNCLFEAADLMSHFDLFTGTGKSMIAASWNRAKLSIGATGRFIPPFYASIL